MKYTFGHTDTAAERLRQISLFFNPLAGNFIESKIKVQVNSAADMGCGPGYTTNMVAKSANCTNVTGIDFSKHFIGLATHQFPQYTFLCKDVTKLLLKTKYDLIYCRFLLSHLKNIPDILAGWTKLLTPDGMIFIDELEDIETIHPVFTRYLNTNESLIRSQGAELYIGKFLNNYIRDFKIVENESSFIPVPDQTAAAWFYPNTVSVWKEEQYITRLIEKDIRDEIANKLLEIKNSDCMDSTICWKMKRILLTAK